MHGGAAQADASLPRPGAASDATFAGLPIGLGTTSLVLSDAAKTTIMIPFVPLWLLICVLNAAAWADAVVKEKKA